MSDVTITAATVAVDGVDIDVRKIGDTAYLLARGPHSFPVEGYDAAIVACDEFAAQVAKVDAATANADKVIQQVAAFADAKRDEYEQAQADTPAG